MTTHTGERRTFYMPLEPRSRTTETRKAFTCPVPGCGRSYTVKSNMRRHMKTHRVEEYEVTEDPNLAPMDPLLDPTQAGGSSTMQPVAVAGSSGHHGREGRTESQLSILLSEPYPLRPKSPDTCEEDGPEQ